MGSLLVVLSIFGIILGGMALGTYSLARRREAGQAARRPSSRPADLPRRPEPDTEQSRDRATDQLLTAWKLSYAASDQ